MALFWTGAIVNIENNKIFGVTHSPENEPTPQLLPEHEPEPLPQDDPPTSLPPENEPEPISPPLQM